MEDSKVDRSDVFREIKAAVSEWPQIHIQEISALPRTGNGKLMRSAVRQLFLKSHGSSREIEASTGSDRHSSGITR
jgi:acyl-coenzyme A synthetase/AMP-(fatty) acid ligase